MDITILNEKDKKKRLELSSILVKTAIREASHMAKSSDCSLVLMGSDGARMVCKYFLAGRYDQKRFIEEIKNRMSSRSTTIADLCFFESVMWIHERGGSVRDFISHGTEKNPAAKIYNMVKNVSFDGNNEELI